MEGFENSCGIVRHWRIESLKANLKFIYNYKLYARGDPYTLNDYESFNCAIWTTLDNLNLLIIEWLFIILCCDNTAK